MGLSGGRQDQYAATFGGFNFMEFHPEERVVVNPLRIKNWILSELEASLLLYFGRVSRQSAQIIDEQARNIRRNDNVAIEATHALKQEAIKMKAGLLRGLVQSMEAGWAAKKRMASSISNPQIEESYELAKEAGMQAGMISGAGGGGFMMLLVDPARRMEVIRALQQTEGQIVTCHFTKYGTQGWKIF